jgi:hypothetical protein
VRAGYLDNINNANLLNIVVASSKVNSQVKGIDDIDFPATQKTSLETAVDLGLDNALGSPTANSLAERVKTLDDNYTATRAPYLDKLANHVTTRIWFSDPQISVTVTAAVPNLALPSVVLPNIAGTIVEVYVGFKFRMVENTNAAANKLDAIQYIQVKKGAGALTNCIKLVDDQFGVAGSTREGGDCVIGNIEVHATVDVMNATYNFQWTAADADLANLVFNDVQTFLIVSYY